MNVREMIEALGAYDPEAEVLVVDGEEAEPFPLYEMYRNDRGQVVIA